MFLKQYIFGVRSKFVWWAYEVSYSLNCESELREVTHSPYANKSCSSSWNSTYKPNSLPVIHCYQVMFQTTSSHTDTATYALFLLTALL